MAVMQEYMHERVARQQFLVSLALERARREQAAAVEHRRNAIEASKRFERSFGYICTHARAVNAAHHTSSVNLLRSGWYARVCARMRVRVCTCVCVYVCVCVRLRLRART